MFFMFLIVLNPFHATIFFSTPGKHQKTSGFLIFSRGIERDQWHEMGCEQLRVAAFFSRIAKLINCIIGAEEKFLTHFWPMFPFYTP